MKVKALKEFIDLEEEVTRSKGDIFECSQTRFKQMLKNGKDKYNDVFVEEIEDKKTSKKK